MGGKSSTLELKNSSKYFKRNIQVDYEIKKHLAIGEFSIVYDAESRDTKYQRAIQEISRSQMTEEDYTQLSETINILQEVRCPNIVKLYEVFEMPYSYYLVYEKMKPETLMEVILERKENPGKFSFHTLFKAEEIKNYMWQILYALSVCFSHNIIHKDIRPENFLIDGDELTLIDFRLAQFVKEKPKFMTRQSMICKSSPLEAVCLKSIDSLPDEDENEIRMIRSGTNFKKIEDFEDQKKNPLRLNINKIPSKEDKSPNEIIVPHKKFGQVHYRAPETFIKEYYYQSDIWSAGVIFYILCTGNLPPFNLQGNNKKASKIQLSDREYYADTPRFSTAPRSKKKSDADTEDFAFIDEIHSDILSEEGKDLMKQMFNQYHYLRISAPFAMRHTYFKKEESYKEVNIDQIKKTIINCVNNSQKSFVNVMLKKLVSLGIAKCEDEEKKFSKEFKSLDDNYTGVLDNDTIRRMSISFSDEEIKVNDNSELHIEYQDYVMNSLDWGALDLKEMISFYFKKLDKSVLTEEEIKNEFKEVDENDMDVFIKNADADGDKIFSQDELFDYLNKEIIQGEEISKE